MVDDRLQQKLVDYVEDAHAMERNVSTMLDSIISTTDDPEIKKMLEDHKRQTKEHERRLRERLDAMGAGTSTGRGPRRSRRSGMGAALFKVYSWVVTEGAAQRDSRISVGWAIGLVAPCLWPALCLGPDRCSSFIYTSVRQIP